MAATTYLYARARLIQSVWLAAGIGVAFIVVSALTNVLWFGIVIGLVCAASIVRALLQSREKRPVLRIGPEGFCYRPFSPRLVSWDNVASINLVKREKLVVAWGKSSYVAQPNLDAIHIALRTLEGYPRSPWRTLSRRVAGIDGLPAILIQLYFLEGADGAAVAGSFADFSGRAVETRTLRSRT